MNPKPMKTLELDNQLIHVCNKSFFFSFLSPQMMKFLLVVILLSCFYAAIGGKHINLISKYHKFITTFLMTTLIS